LKITRRSINYSFKFIKTRQEISGYDADHNAIDGNEFTFHNWIDFYKVIYYPD
jgi:hypothetical protein